VYSYGISDAPQGVFLYSPAQPTGVQVTGKPGQVTLPPPFDQVPSPPGHEIHDKFVVCGINGNDPVVYCGSSNLATGGEAANGDNLLAVHDADVATVFAIEALGLVDHYNFLDRMANPKKAAPKKKAGTTSSATKGVAQEQSAAWCEESDGKEEGGRRQTLSAHRSGDTAKAENIWQHKDVRDEESQQEKIDCEEDSKIGAAEQVAVGIEIGAAGDAGAGIGGHWEERKGENQQAAASETRGRGRQRHVSLYRRRLVAAVFRSE